MYSAPASNIVIDTTHAATDTVDYVAADTYAATATRTVIIAAPSKRTSSPPAATSSSSAAASTAQ